MFFESLKKLYTEDKINIICLDIAVKKGWITEIQKKEIVGA